MNRIPFLSALLLTSTLAHADTWSLDAAHSRVGFSVDHLMVSSVEGQFADAEAKLQYNPGELSSVEVEVTVDISSVDTRNEKRDEHLRSSDFLDAPTFPTMTFRSTAVKPRGDGRFDLVGDLTLRGVTRSVTLKGEGLDRVVTDPWGGTRVGASAQGIIDRKDFGVAWNQALETGGVLVGDEVRLRIDAEFVRSAE